MSKTNKRHETSCYCHESIEKKIVLMKCYPPAGDWRWIDKTSNNIVMTYLLQTENYSGEQLRTVKHLCLWEMKHTITSMLSDKKCKNKLVLPSLLKNQTQNKKCNKDLMEISVTNLGPHVPSEYYPLFCRTYESDPELLSSFLGPKPTYRNSKF